MKEKFEESCSMTSFELLNPNMTSVFQSILHTHGGEVGVNKVTYKLQIISKKNCCFMH